MSDRDITIVCLCPWSPENGFTRSLYCLVESHWREYVAEHPLERTRVENLHAAAGVAAGTQEDKP